VADPAGLNLASLQEYFDSTVSGCAGPLRAELMHGGKSNLTYAITDGVHRWVLRRPPLGVLTPTAHDMGREFRVVAALGGSDVPVAEAVALCEDTSVLGVPFSVVSEVDGVVLRDEADAAKLTEADAARCASALVAALARLHAVDYVSVGLAGFGKPEGYLGRQVKRWREQWTRVATRSLPELDELHDRLAAALPERSASSIVHGDYRLDNVILRADDPSRIAAIVDWEMATLGDPLADLGLMLVYWDPVCRPVLGAEHPVSANAGFPSIEELAEEYSLDSGASLDELPFYRALGYYKLAVIAEGIHARYLAGETVGEGFDAVGTAVAGLLESGLDVLRGGR
jgi:aminoglycoside phosphotransferase (APT) family kinase protein